MPRYRTLRPMDNACLLDGEELEGPSPFMTDLRNDMGICSVDYLAKHYPELTFCHVPGRKRPKGHDLVESCQRGWVVADWRTAAQP